MEAKIRGNAGKFFPAPGIYKSPTQVRPQGPCEPPCPPSLSFAKLSQPQAGPAGRCRLGGWAVPQIAIATPTKSWAPTGLTGLGDGTSRAELQCAAAGLVGSEPCLCHAPNLAPDGDPTWPRNGSETTVAHRPWNPAPRLFPIMATGWIWVSERQSFPFAIPILSVPKTRFELQPFHILLTMVPRFLSKAK